MNTPILFLLGALSLSMLGGLVVWLASRPRRERFGSTIESFSRDLDALAPPAIPRGRPAARPHGDHTGAAPRSDPRRQVANGHTRTRPAPGPRVRPPDSETN